MSDSDESQAKDLSESKLDQSEPILLSFKPIEPESELPRLKHVCIHNQINGQFLTIDNKLNQLQISNNHQQNN